MDLITIDKNKCKKDGICAMECPMAIISWEKGEFPGPVEGAQDFCISCGHCVAACPHGALTHRDMAPQDCLEINDAMALSPEQTEHFLRARRSIRNFKKQTVSRDTLSQILTVASHAPSGHNCQPVEWQAITGRKAIRPYAQMVIEWMKVMLEKKPDMAKMMHLDRLTLAWDMGRDLITRNAPNLLLAAGDAKNPMAPDACKIALTYFDIAAQSFGVGTCWCGYFFRAATVYPPLKEALGLDGRHCHGVMAAGYPVVKPGSGFSFYACPDRNIMSKIKMLIAQISDIHLKPSGALAYDVADRAGALEKVVAHINRLQPFLLCGICRRHTNYRVKIISEGSALLFK